MMTEFVLQLEGVKRSFLSGDRELEVLRNINLEVSAGELVGLVGPSGSGKSTLLHIAGLLDRPDQGRIMFRGSDCFELSDCRRTRLRREKLGFVYQFHHLLAEFNAIDNVAMPLLAAGTSRKEATLRANDLLDRMKLSERKKHQPAQLSGGEQQRVAIARALANDPSLVIADEPTGNLDWDTTNEVFEAFIEIVRQKNASVLVATHNRELFERMDRVLTIRDGELSKFE